MAHALARCNGFRLLPVTRGAGTRPCTTCITRGSSHAGQWCTLCNPGQSPGMHK